MNLGLCEKDFGPGRQGGTSEADGESDLRCGLWGIWEMEVMRLQRVIQIAESRKIWYRVKSNSIFQMNDTGLNKEFKFTHY